MEFKIGQRVKFLKYWEGTGTVESRPGGLSPQFYIVRGNADAGPYFNVTGGFTTDELEDASCCGNQHEPCAECPLDEPTDGCPCVGDPPCEDCPAKVPPGVEVADFIAGREGKPRTGSEAVMLDPRSGDTGIFARPSTAPNADRIEQLEQLEDNLRQRVMELEAKVASLESFENGSVARIASLEAQLHVTLDLMIELANATADIEQESKARDRMLKLGLDLVAEEVGLKD